MDEKRTLLKHFLAALAYRTQKVLRDAPPEFADFRAAPQVRTPHELIRHMDSVLGYSRTYFLGGTYQPPILANFSAAIAHFHEVLTDVARHIDAMTHAGQLALLRRLSGSPVAPENFIFADITAENLSPNQPQPRSPDKDWPERP
jgi:hypothetical protein